MLPAKWLKIKSCEVGGLMYLPRPNNLTLSDSGASRDLEGPCTVLPLLCEILCWLARCIFSVGGGGEEHPGFNLLLPASCFKGAF